MYKYGRIVLVCILKKPSDSTEPGPKSLLKKHPTALDLLDKYVATVEKINSFAATTESSMKATSLIEKGKKGQYWSTSEGYYNGQKALVRNKLWGWVNETMHFTKDNPYYKIRLWDGQFYYGYDANPNAKRPEGSVYIITAEEVNRKQKYSADSIIGEFPGSYIIGLLPNHTRRIDTILRQAETIKISNKTEKIGEISCYVMEAKTKWGDYRVWFDPTHDYQITKLCLEMKPGHSFDNGYIFQGKDHLSITFRQSRFQKVDGLWIPITCKVIYKRTFSHGEDYSHQYDCKVTTIRLHPDHEKENSFVSNGIQDGAQVRFITGETKLDKTRYTWRGGQVLNEQGNVILDTSIQSGNSAPDRSPSTAESNQTKIP